VGVGRRASWVIRTKLSSTSRGATIIRSASSPTTRAASTEDQVKALVAEIIALPRDRVRRQRTSARTTAERHNGHTEEVTYTISIEKSNLPEWDTTPKT
jgi:hypothetical protein